MKVSVLLVALLATYAFAYSDELFDQFDAMATATASPMPTGTPTPNPTPTPTPAPVPGASIMQTAGGSNITLTFSNGMFSLSAVPGFDDDDHVYTLAPQGLQLMTLDNDVYTPASNHALVPFGNWTGGAKSSSTMVSGTPMTAMAGPITFTVTNNFLVNSSVVVQSYEIKDYPWADNQTTNGVGILYQWSSSDGGSAKNKLKTSVQKNGNNTFIQFGEAFCQYIAASATAGGVPISAQLFYTDSDKDAIQFYISLPFKQPIGGNTVTYSFQTDYGLANGPLGSVTLPGSLKTVANGGFPAWGIILIVLGSVLILAGIIGLAVGAYVLLKKKRQGYEAI